MDILVNGYDREKHLGFEVYNAKGEQIEDSWTTVNQMIDEEGYLKFPIDEPCFEAR